MMVQCQSLLHSTGCSLLSAGRPVAQGEAANRSGRGGGDPLPAQPGPPAQRHQAQERPGGFAQPLQELLVSPSELSK